MASSLGARLPVQVFLNQWSFQQKPAKQSVSPATRLLVLINPNNPTGTTISQDVIRDVLKNFPTVLVDEAYFNSAEKPQRVYLTFPNLIILRTFSKALALLHCVSVM